MLVRMAITSILLPTRPQPDTIVAIFLLQKYGTDEFPGIETATVSIRNALTEDETFNSLIEQGTMALDVGGGPFDHHGTQKTTSELIAEHLGIRQNPELTQLIAYAVRDDTQGKGTLSNDPLDRAFGLSGLIGSLNKLHTDDPNCIVRIVLPLLEAHHYAALQHMVELPKEIEEKQRAGEYYETYALQGKNKLKIAFVVSDKPSMPSYLRSQHGRQADVVVQKSSNTNHYAILTRQYRKVNLSKVMALIRLREAEILGIEVKEEDLEMIRTMLEIPFWYFDPATNSLLNGGPHNRSVEESHVVWNEMLRIVPAGVRMG